MRHLIIFISFLSMVWSSAIAQTYTGRIEDSDSKQAIEFANIIVLQKSDNKYLTGVTSAEDGSFCITIDSGTPFYIVVRSIGYESAQISTLTQENLGTILLKPRAMKISEVTIVGRRKLIQQKPDRLVFDIQNFPLASVGSAVDAMKVTPGLNVQNSSISIIGKQSVVVMINERIVKMTGEELINYLHSIPAQNIKQIEVITTPPAKYDAEGNSGLINIKLKSMDNNSWSNQVHSSYKQGEFFGGRIGNTFAYNKNKIALTLSFDANKGYRGMETETKIYYSQETWDGLLNSKEKTDNISAHIGFDYQLTPKSSIGVFYSSVFNNNDATDSYNTKIYDNSNNHTKGTILSNGHNDKNNKIHSLNAHYMQAIGSKGYRLSSDVDYFNYINKQNRLIHSILQRDETSDFDVQNIGLQNIKNISAKIDFEHPIIKGMLTYGTKWTKTSTNNETKLFNIVENTAELDTDKSNDFDYHENIGAIYSDIAKTFNEKWSFKAGIRLEYTRTEGYSKQYNQTDKNDYWKLFPTAYISYKHNQDNVFNLNYSRRISRPGFWSLNPFKFYLNSTTYQEGTPDLKPQISDNIEIQHIYKGRLITKLYGVLITDGYGSIPTIDVENQMQVYKSSNFWDGLIVGLNETFLYNPTRWWNTVSTLATYLTKGYLKKGLNLNMSNMEGVRYQFYTRHTFFFNKSRTIIGELTYMYNSPDKNIISKSRSSQFLNIGVKAVFLNGKLQCSATLNDIFKTQQPYYDTYTNGIKQTYRNYYDNRMFTLGLSYSFGSSKIKAKQHKAGNRNEYNRINN